MDIKAALVEFDASRELASKLPDGLALLRAAANRLAGVAQRLGESAIEEEALALASHRLADRVQEVKKSTLCTSSLTKSDPGYFCQSDRRTRCKSWSRGRKLLWKI